MKTAPSFARLALAALAAASALGCGERRDVSAQDSGGGGDPEVIARRIYDLREKEARGFRSPLPLPDGRQVAFSLDGQLAIEDLETGAIRPIATRTSFYAWPSGVSPDGRWLAFTKNDCIADGSECVFEVGVIRIDGTGERTLVNIPNVHRAPVNYVDVSDWSPDGARLLVSVSLADGTWQLAEIRIDTGERIVLRSIGWSNHRGAVYSPDGRWIAYSRPPQQDATSADIYLLAVDGNSESRLTSGQDVNRVVGWTEQGSIYFSRTMVSALTSTSSLWRADVRNGRLTSAPALVRADMSDVDRFSYTSGRIYYSVHSFPRPGLGTPPRDVMAMAVDLDGGRVITQPYVVLTRAVVGPPQGDLIPNGLGQPAPQVRWTSDGQALWYLQQTRANLRELGVYSLLSGEERRFPLEVGGLHSVTPVDDRTILVAGMHRERGQVELRAFTVDLYSGQVTPHPEDEDLSNGRALQFSPDGATRYVTRPAQGATEPASEFHLIARDLTSGRERVLYHGPIDGRNGGAWRLSPDGSRVVLSRAGGGGRQLVVIDTRTAATLVAYESEDLIGPRSLNWSPDGRTLVFFKVDPGAINPPANPRLWMAWADGSGARLLFDGPLGQDPQLGPDGRRIVFHSPTGSEPVGEFWVLENLPDSRGRADSSTAN